MKIAWKTWTAMILVVSLVLGLNGCGQKEAEPEIVIPEEIVEIAPEAEELPEEPVIEPLSDLAAEITWWTYPIFVQDAGSEAGAYEQQIIDEFVKYYPNIRVKVEVLDYETGPGKVEDAISVGAAPDVLFDGPERIGTYGKKGLLADLADLFDEEYRADLANEALLSACMAGETYVMYPLSMVNYCMAFNKQMLETCGAIDLMNREGARAWDTATFEQVLEKLDYSGFKPGILHCSGVSGDYATRSFLTNLYDASLMNADCSAYTFEGDKAVSALSKLKDWATEGWLLNGSGETGASAVEAFVIGDTAYTFLWSLPQAIANAAALEENGIEVVEMPYPSQDGVPVLEYMMNGFCVFDSQDEDRVQASKYFLEFIGDREETAKHVVRTGAVSVRKSLKDIYQGNEDAMFYEALTSYSGPYYKNVKGFEAMRVYWYQMIAEVLNGEYGAKASVESFQEYANETLKGE